MVHVPPVTKALLIVNVVLFLIDVMSKGEMDRYGVLTRYGAFAVQSAIFEGRIYEFLTFQFLHGHITHIIFNSIGLYFFGPLMERWWGSKKFLVFYLLSGAGGAVFYAVLVLAGVFGDPGLVGASAGIYGIIVGVAVIAPQAKVQLLFPPVTLTMRNLALIVLGIAVFSIVTGWGGNAGGEAGHLGGAIVGFLLVKFPRALSWIGNRSSEMDIIRPKAFARKSEAKLRPRSRVDLTKDTEVDRILDKINKDGFQSLTDEERAILHRASNSNKTTE